MSNRSRWKISIIVSLCAVVSVVHADAALHFESLNPDNTVRGQDLSVYAGGGKVAMVSRENDSPRFTVIYDDDKKGFTLLDHVKRTRYYVDVPMVREAQQGRQNIESQVASKARTVQKKYRDAYRRRALEMQDWMMGGAPLQDIRHRAAGSGGSEPFRCNEFHVYQGESQLRSVCIAAYADLELASADADLLDQMRVAALEIATSTPRYAQLIPQLPVDFVDGVPVRIEYRGKRKAEEARAIRLSKIDQSSADKRIFRIPESYRENAPVHTKGGVF